MARRAGLRLTLNLLILAASLLFILGAVWTVAGGALANDSVPARLYAPAVRTWAAYAQLGMAGKLLALLAAAAALAMLLFVFLFTFRWRVEEWAIIALSGPVYLLVALVIALGLNLFISMIKLIRPLLWVVNL
ncbi:MAG: hypothetical protein V7641_4560 [Blastocatellia bacterium]